MADEYRTQHQEPEGSDGQGANKVVSVLGYATPVAVGVAAVVHSYANLGFGELEKPGAGFWPLIVSIVLTISSGVLLIVLAPHWPRERFARHSVQVAVAMVTAATFALLLEPAGALISGALLVLAWMRLLGGESWRLSLTVSVVTTIIFTVVFIELLGVPLPALPTIS